MRSSCVTRSYVILDYADPSMNRDLTRFAAARDALKAQGFDDGRDR